MMENSATRKDSTVYRRNEQPNGNLKRLRLGVAARNYSSVPIMQALEEIAKVGFDVCDNFNWRSPTDLTEYIEGLRRFGLGAGVLVVNKKPDVDAPGCSLTSPNDRDGFLDELQLCIEAAKKVNCRQLEVLTGNDVPGVSKADQMKSCAETLRSALPLLEEHGMTAVVEMLNNTEEHPGYFLGTVRDGLDLIDKVGSARVRLLFDIYHVQLTEGNIIKKLRNHIDYIGMIHFADVPGRHEPGTGEINFRNVFQAIYDLRPRYDGHVTAEYGPTDHSFQDLAHIMELATFA